ncbi:Hypothetical protein, putative [Bodo saltans]|uniref:Uncharacterized protein n=1 Tax=Bodo saltans TaxID=75058 RepID=A0A0S4IU60_BODSA|nr:Hypothetical protein, putative [Bodo saltans]|eukprot:CUG08739.1 Hypothetical protein, putative [Bodo saltans]
MMMRSMRPAINNQLRMSRAINSALAQGMRSSATPERCKDHCTQGPLQSTALRVRLVVDQTLAASVGLVSRSLNLRTGTLPPTLPEMTPAEGTVVDQIRQRKTVERVLMRNLVRVDAADDSDESIEDIENFMQRVANVGRSSDLRMTVGKLLDLSLGRDCVAFFTLADRNLIVGVATFGDNLPLPRGMRELAVIELLKRYESTSMVQYRIYSAVDGLDTISNDRGEQSAARYNDLVQFLVCAVKQFDDRRHTAHSIIRSSLFKGWRVTVQQWQYIGPVRIAATSDDLAHLQDQHAHAARGNVLDVGTEFMAYQVSVYNEIQKRRKAHCPRDDVATVLFDLGTSTTSDSDQNVVIIIGGESGSGKTWRMITNNSPDSHLVVYVRFHEPIDQAMILPTREARLTALLELKIKVEAAIKTACPELLDMLRLDDGKMPFEVRLCFDDMGRCPPLVRACCAMGCGRLRAALGWKLWVRIRVFVVGNGVGMVGDPADPFSKLATLHSAEPSIYWQLRRDGLRDGAFHDMREVVSAIAAKWGDEAERRERDAMLRGYWRDAFEKMSREHRGVLVREALLSAVEADVQCRALLPNPRLGTLVFARCGVVAADFVESGLWLMPTGADVRREVLLPVVKGFKERSGLRDATAEETGLMLVEALRYALFDGYASADPDTYGAAQLIFGRGVLVDNSVYRDTADKDYERVDKNADKGYSFFAAYYHKDLGRYSISPAMAVVLRTLTLSAFGGSVAYFGDSLKHAVARLVYVAVQVFRGRPVAELVDFIVGSQGVLDAERGDTSARNVVAFSSLTLRTNSTLSIGPLPTTAKRDSAAAPHAEARDQLEELWRQEDVAGGAWVEIYSDGLSCADVVLHIPGVVTLPIRCMGNRSSVDDKDVNDGPLVMLDDSAVADPAGQSTLALLSPELTALGAPVVPTLCLSSRAPTLHDAKCPEIAQCTSACERCRVGTRGAPSAVNASGLGVVVHGDDWRNAARLHRIRAMLMLFDHERKEEESVVVATAPKRACCFS